MDSWRGIGGVRFAGPAYSSAVLSSKPEFPVHGVGLTLCQSAPVCLISESSAFSRKFNGSVSGSASTLAVDAPLEPVFHLSVALK